VLAQIQLVGGNAVTEAGQLWEWLRQERALAGRVELIRRPPGPTDLGGVLDLLTVAVGSGGAAAVLAQSLSAWLATRRANVKVTVTTEAGTITVEATGLAQGEVLPALRQVLPSDDA
jgi:hypothetical protein